MTHLADVIPYMPSSQWYSRWLRARLAGLPESSAVRMAGTVYYGTSRYPRQLCRTIVAGAKGQPPITLSLPIEGGAHSVKKLPPELWTVSQHGRWQLAHFGAFEAAYASSAYFSEYGNRLGDIILHAEGKFATLTESLHRLTLHIIRAEENIPSLLRMWRSNRELFEGVAMEKSEGVTYEMSFFDVIFHKGDDAIFALCKNF